MNPIKLTTMKKTYIQPITNKVKISTVKMIAASGRLSGDGVDMRINDTGTSGDAESRRGGSIWDDEE